MFATRNAGPVIRLVFFTIISQDKVGEVVSLSSRGEMEPPASDHRTLLPPLLHPLSPALAALHFARITLALHLPPAATKDWCRLCGGLRHPPSAGTSRASKSPASKKRKSGDVETPAPISPPLAAGGSTTEKAVAIAAPASALSPRRRACQTCGISYARSRLLEMMRLHPPALAGARKAYHTRSSGLHKGPQPPPVPEAAVPSHAAPQVPPSGPMATPTPTAVPETHGRNPESAGSGSDSGSGSDPNRRPPKNASMDRLLEVALSSNGSPSVPSASKPVSLRSRTGPPRKPIPARTTSMSDIPGADFSPPASPPRFQAPEPIQTPTLPPGPRPASTAMPPPSIPKAIKGPKLRLIKNTEPNPPTYPPPPPVRRTPSTSSAKGSPTPTGPPGKKRKKHHGSALSKLVAEGKERESASAVSSGGSWGLN